MSAEPDDGNGLADAVEDISARVRETEQAYSPQPRPLRGYAGAMATYGGLVGAIALAARRTGALPDRISPWDVTLLSAATYRLSRTLAKDAVTSPLRAPFTRYVEPGGPSELNEEVRTHGGWKHAVGELITCPFCLGQWVATALMAGHLLAPRATRAATATLTAVAVADALQFGYAKLQQLEG